MALKDEVFIDGAWRDANAAFTNLTGTGLTSVAESGTGELISDEYGLTFSAVTGGTCTITVVTVSPNNPYNGRVVTGVTANGSTAAKNVVPGIAVVVASGVANGNTSKVFAGVYLGLFDASGVDAGTPSDGLRHRVTNNSASPASDCKIRLLTQAISVLKTGRVFEYVRQYAVGATEKVTGGTSQVVPYKLKVVNVAGSGSAKTADLQVDTVTLGAASLIDIQTGATVSGTGIKAVSGYGYRVATGPLTGLEFALNAGCVESDIENVLIFTSRFVQIAPDTSGTEGTYGPTDVALTQSGQSSGVIAPAGAAYYWIRVLVPLSGNAESNPYPANVVLEASETSAAGWLV